MSLISRYPFIKSLFRAAIALILLFILIKKGPFQFEQIKFILSQPKILILGFILFSIQFFLLALRWKIIVDLLSKIKLLPAVAFTLIGHFFSFFIPGGVGGDVVKALELSSNNSLSKSEALSTVFADRILGLYSMVLASSLFLMMDYIQEKSHQISNYLSFSLMLWFVMTVGLIFGPTVVQFISKNFNQKKHRWIITLEKIILSFNLTFACCRRPKLAFSVFLISLMSQFLSIYFMLEVVKVLHVTPPSFFVFFSFACFGFLASAIPITPAGIGVGQAAVYFLFSTISPELGHATVTAISALQIFYLFFALIGGILFSTKPLLKNKMKAQI